MLPKSTYAGLYLQTFNGNATLLFPLFQGACGSSVSPCFSSSTPSPSPQPGTQPEPTPMPSPSTPLGTITLSLTQQGSLVMVYFLSDVSITNFVINFTLLGTSECPTVFAGTDGEAFAAGIVVLGVGCNAVGVAQTGTSIPPTVCTTCT